MKRQAPIIFLLALIAALMGSYVTYSLYIQRDNPVQAEPTVKLASDKTGEKPENMALNNSVVGSDLIVKAVEKLGPSVVYITTRTNVPTSGKRIGPGHPGEYEDYFGPDDSYRGHRQKKGSGSGIIISEDGLILTNQHVIDNASNIRVKIDTSPDEKEKKARVYNAKVIGQDRLNDVAIIKVDAKNLKAAALGDSDRARVGEWVIAVGNPLGYEHTVTVGVLSFKGRDVRLALDREYPNLLQTDAAINPGNSGGPLANLRGEVIGMNTAINPVGTNISFAIPINKIKSIKDQLISNGKVVRAFIGIQMIPMDKAKADYLGMSKIAGILVYRVFRNTPAYIAGLKKGDVILEIDGKEVNSVRELQKKIRKMNVGQETILKIWRNRKLQTIRVKVAEMPDRSSLKR